MQSKQEARQRGGGRPVQTPLLCTNRLRGTQELTAVRLRCNVSKLTFIISTCVPRTGVARIKSYKALPERGKGKKSASGAEPNKKSCKGHIRHWLLCCGGDSCDRTCAAQRQHSLVSAATMFTVLMGPRCSALTEAPELCSK